MFVGVRWGVLEIPYLLYYHQPSCNKRGQVGRYYFHFCVNFQRKVPFDTRGLLARARAAG